MRDWSHKDSEWYWAINVASLGLKRETNGNHITWHMYSPLHDIPTASSLTWLPLACPQESTVCTDMHVFMQTYGKINNKTPCDLNHVMYCYCVPTAHHRRLSEHGLVDVCSDVVSGQRDWKLLRAVVRCDTGRTWPITSHVCEPCPPLQVLVPAGHRWHGVPELVHHRWRGISYLLKYWTATGVGAGAHNYPSRSCSTLVFA